MSWQKSLIMLLAVRRVRIQVSPCACKKVLVLSFCPKDSKSLSKVKGLNFLPREFYLTTDSTTVYSKEKFTVVSRP